MYHWRQISPEEQQELLTLRQTKGNPWHSPPHFDVKGEHTYILTAACYEHAPILTLRKQRLQEITKQLLEIFHEYCEALHAWCVLPNHYHALLSTENMRLLRKALGQFHGRSARQWNLEDNTPGRKVWFNCFERVIRSERHFFASLNYIHHNAVHHHLAERWQDWAFSSASEFLKTAGKEEATRIWNQYPVLDYGKGWDD